MACDPPVTIRSFDYSVHGLRTVTAHGDGYSFTLEWHKSYANPSSWNVVYNIYWSSQKSDVFSEGVKGVSSDANKKIIIQGNFKLGDVYYFAVRAAAHEPNSLLFDYLPEVDGLKLYPEAVLRENISASDTIIPVDDASVFPPTGIVLIGAELIRYSAVDLVDNNLLVFTENDRGLYGYQQRIHTTDGYDGYHYFSNPFVQLWKGFEDQNTSIGLEENKFEHQYAYTVADGYKEKKDLIYGSENLKVVDEANAGHPTWDHAGWDRDHLSAYISGKCIGTYFGGEYGCSDDEETGNNIRGISVQDHINMREEYLLQLTGEPAMLFRRMKKGKTSLHYDSSRENVTHRGLDTFGTELVTGYEQFFNPRRSDGRIFVRFGPTKEDLKREEPGVENSFIPNCWIGTIPTIQDGDFLIRFNQNGSEEWRYEIIDVERNRTLLHESGLQKFTAVRVRKTDPIYQVKSIRDTSMFPRELLTSVGLVPGILPHTHRIVVNEGIMHVSQVNQMTSVDQGHNHEVINGIVSNVLGHVHEIIIP
ncbi:MAG: hypothetical protein WC942_01390 [Clostridia bacterium]|jgi:hypothetical protein